MFGTGFYPLLSSLCMRLCPKSSILQGNLGVVIFESLGILHLAFILCILSKLSNVCTAPRHQNEPTLLYETQILDQNSQLIDINKVNQHTKRQTSGIAQATPMSARHRSTSPATERPRSPSTRSASGCAFPIIVPHLVAENPDMLWPMLLLLHSRSWYFAL